MKRLKNRTVFIIMMFQVLMVWAGCAPKDTTIKADLATLAKSEKDFAGVRFTVDKGIVTLDGECATNFSKDKVAGTAKGVYGVKSVVNNIMVAPVVIGTDEQLRQGIDSILKQYPAVEAITRDSIVYLQGKLPDDKVLKLKNAINTLKPKMVDARITLR